MKQIIAIVKPFLADRVLEELNHAPLEAMQVQSVKGYGRQKNYLDRYTETEYSRVFTPKVEFQLWVQDSRVDEVVKMVRQASQSGRIGDGKIFVVPVADQTTVIRF